MCVTGTLPRTRGALFPPQMAGGLVGSALNSCMFPGPIATITQLTNSTSIAQGVFTEMLLTSLLIFVVLMLATNNLHRARCHRTGVVCCRVVPYVYLSLWQLSFGVFSTKETGLSLCLGACFTL
jgi:glycerol uptake facilitator-like aquaporin